MTNLQENRAHLDSNICDKQTFITSQCRGCINLNQ